MNIQTVASNLRNTIAGKEQYLLAIQKERTFVGLRDGEDIALKAVADFLTININELKVILFDVEKCCEKATIDSWEQNPDRTGGQFTQEEIDNASCWN
jgi:hypothetical protein